MENQLYFDYNFISRHNGMFIEHAGVAYDDKMHICPYIMLAYAAHGTCLYCTESSETELCEGDIVLARPMLSHRFSTADPKSYMSMYCASFFPEILPYRLDQISGKFPELADFFEGRNPYIIIHDSDKKDIRNLMIRMLDDFSYFQPGCEFNIAAILAQALIYVFRIAAASSIKKDAMNNNVIVGHIINYVNRNFYKKISLDEMAALMHITPQYLCRIFKQHSGTTFNEYLNNLRIEKLKDELEHTDRPLFMIFGDYELSREHLNRLFKRATGYTIPQYKEKFNYKSNNILYNMN